jgi:ankyrin repeat protein
MSQTLKPGGHGEAVLLKVALILASEGYWQDVKQLTLVSRLFRSDEQLWDVVVDKTGGGEKLRTRLMYASMRGNRPRLIFLLHRGAYVEAVNNWGWNSLGFASGYGHLEVVRELCEWGANVDAGDGLTALMWAAQNGHVEVVSELCQRGANKDATNVPFYCSPLLCAVKNSRLDVVRELCKQGASMETRTYLDGHTPLMIACQKEKEGALEMVEAMLGVGADVNATCKGHKNTPLMFAAHSGSLDIVTCLISHGASTSAKSKDGMTAKDFVSPGKLRRALREALTPATQ